MDYKLININCDDNFWRVRVCFQCHGTGRIGHDHFTKQRHRWYRAPTCSLCHGEKVIQYG
jgi:DnaJ-class molecular chaperone